VEQERNDESEEHLKGHIYQKDEVISKEKEEGFVHDKIDVIPHAHPIILVETVPIREALYESHDDGVGPDDEEYKNHRDDRESPLNRLSFFNTGKPAAYSCHL
jgi:hypothetical protein